MAAVRDIQEESKALRPDPTGSGSPVLTHREEKTGPEGPSHRKGDRFCPGRIARGFIARWSHGSRHTRRRRAFGLAWRHRSTCLTAVVGIRLWKLVFRQFSSVQGTRAGRAPSQDADPRCTRAGVEGARRRNEAVLFVSLTLVFGRGFDEHGR